MKSREDLKIRPLNFDDIGSLVGLVKEVLDPPFLTGEMAVKLFDWKLKLNPSLKEGSPLGFVLEAKDGIVGAVVLMPVELKIGAERVCSCFEVDLMVKPEYRFSGLKLMNQVWNSKILSIIFATTPNETSYKIEESFGAKGVSFTKNKYVIITNALRFAAKKHSFKPLKIVAYIFALLLVLRVKLFSWILSVCFREKLFIQKVERFNEKFDTFFEEASHNYSVLAVRNSRYLNWRYIDFPFGERIVYAASDTNGKLRGYVVMQKEMASNGMKSVNILELFTKAHDIEAIIVLLNVVREYAYNNSCERLEIIPCSKTVAKVASFCGFIRQKLSLPACIYKSSDALWSNMENGFISSGDGDTSLYSALTIDHLE